MNPRVKTMWIEALRSGEYEQGIGNLAVYDVNNTLTHCCLGVLCELAVKDGLPISREESRDDNGEPYPENDREGVAVHFDSSDCLLPESVMVWAGLDDDAGSFLEPDGDIKPDGEPFRRQADLAGRNDGGASFTEIADLIEKYF